MFGFVCVKVAKTYNFNIFTFFFLSVHNMGRVSYIWTVHHIRCVISYIWTPLNEGKQQSKWKRKNLTTTTIINNNSNTDIDIDIDALRKKLWKKNVQIGIVYENVST